MRRLEAMEALREALLRHSKPTGQPERTAVPALSLVRTDERSVRVPALYWPLFCVQVVGKKRVSVGSEVFGFGPGDCFLVTTDLPVVASVTEASAAAPFLAICIEIDRSIVAEIATSKAPSSDQTTSQESGIYPGRASSDVVEVVHRMMSLLDHPDDAPVLGRLYLHELHYRLYTGAWGASLQALAHNASRIGRVNTAVSWIREHFRERFVAEALAARCGTTVSTMNRHFRQVTGLSPLEYHKRVRLQEARVLMMTGELNVSEASYAVGYASASQFSREYVRLFGSPPGKDVRAALLED